MRTQAAALALIASAAWSAAAQTPERHVTLTVKPMLCITDRREESCNLSILVSWRSDRAGSYCLHSDLADGPIQCWQIAESGTVVEERVVRETFKYWLTAGASGTRLAEATLDVMSVESDDRRRNRRRRHVWDIL
ncbi:MAG TPA: DUF3019 domain-containing protein [Gammaproteobacteria bacterium]